MHTAKQVVNPLACNEWHKAFDQLARCLERLVRDPLSRSRVTSDNPKDELPSINKLYAVTQHLFKVIGYKQGGDNISPLAYAIKSMYAPSVFPVVTSDLDINRMLLKY